MPMCQCELCIFNIDCECGLLEIGVTSAGVCKDCILVTLDDATLEKAKRKGLDKFEDDCFKMVEDSYIK